LDVSPILALAFLVALANSGYFFYLGRDLRIARRILASLHGLLAVAILPLAYIVAQFNVFHEPENRARIVYILFIVSLFSIIYSIVVLRDNWRVHLLHLATVTVLIFSFTIGLLLVLGT
jgi:hypothetical protein